MTVITGDCRETLKEIADGSVSSIVTDYLPIIAARCAWAEENIETPEATLFDGDNR